MIEKMLRLILFFCFFTNFRSSALGEVLQISLGMRAKVEEFCEKIELGNENNSIPIYDNMLCSSMFAEGWSSTFNSTWFSSANEAYGSEKTLPSEIRAIANSEISTDPESSEKLVLSLVNGPNIFLKDQAERDAFSAMGFGFSGALDNQPDSVPLLLATYSEFLPVRKGDIALYYVSTMTARGPDRFMTASPLQIQSWCDLAKSKNPIYRLIAAQSFEKVISRGQKALFFTFYMTFADEADPDICACVIDTLMDCGFKEHAEIIRAIEKNLKARGNIELSEVAGEKANLLETEGE